MNDELDKRYPDITAAVDGDTKNLSGVGGPGKVAQVSSRTGGYC
tara:strand:- start:372 stop:503 length:132 start_codon:yes stop_codon:yes gene_type:complete